MQRGELHDFTFSLLGGDHSQLGHPSPTAATAAYFDDSAEDSCVRAPLMHLSSSFHVYHSVH